MANTRVVRVEPVDMKLEVVVLGVSDVDRRQPPPPTATWRRPFVFFPDDAVRVAALLLRSPELEDRRWL